MLGLIFIVLATIISMAKLRVICCLPYVML